MLVQLIKPDSILLEDPVRPGIWPEERISFTRDVWALIEDKQVAAILCVAHKNNIPTTEEELLCKSDILACDNAILYSIWSYRKGAGSKLVREYLEWVRIPGSSSQRVVTMSPKTEMARNFHYKNGARLLQANEETVNYEY
jgi:hypothetical protein